MGGKVAGKQIEGQGKFKSQIVKSIADITGKVIDTIPTTAPPEIDDNKTPAPVPVEPSAPTFNFSSLQTEILNVAKRSNNVDTDIVQKMTDNSNTSIGCYYITK